MSDFTIYHNPRCSKSRNTLALLEENGVSPVVVLYLETPPDRAEIEGLLAKLPPAASVCGEGSESLTGLLDSQRILSGDSPTRSPASMLSLAERMISDGQLTPASELRPIYARQPSITLRKT